jgi:hypothetical protein
MAKKKIFLYVSFQSYESVILVHWTSMNECSMQRSENEITQTLGSFILGRGRIPNWIPDTAVCPCPGEITDAGGFITTHL